METISCFVRMINFSFKSIKKKKKKEKKGKFQTNCIKFSDTSIETCRSNNFIIFFQVKDPYPHHVLNVIDAFLDCIRFLRSILNFNYLNNKVVPQEKSKLKSTRKRRRRNNFSLLYYYIFSWSNSFRANKFLYG